MKLNIIDIRTVSTAGKGALSFLEAGKDVPFEIHRVYYTYGAPEGCKRGGHAHRSLKQILFCPYGQISIILDDGTERETVVLDSPSKGLVVEDMTWREMVWDIEGSVLVVAASGYYDEADYIRDYEVFLSELEEA